MGLRWPEEVRPHKEQERKDRKQAGQRERKEGLRSDPGVDRGRAEGAQGLELEGLRADQWEDGLGSGPVRQGEVLLLELSGFFSRGGFGARTRNAPRRGGSAPGVGVFHTCRAPEPPRLPAQADSVLERVCLPK